MKRTLIALAAVAAVTAVALPALAGQGYGPGWYRGMAFGDCAGPANGQGPQAGREPGQGRGRFSADGGQGRGWFADGPAARMGRGNGPGPDGSRFATVDADQNGAVSAEEAAQAVEGVYAAMDADDDGTLTIEEYMAVRMGPQQGTNAARQAAMQDLKAKRFATLDGNGDGTVTRAEFIDGGKAHFLAADDDKDGSVTPWEFRRHAFN